jgi:hypothetical protein
MNPSPERKVIGKMKEGKIRNVEVEEEQGHLIRWQRKNRPPILIDLGKQCVRTELVALENFDREDIEHQASIVLRLLKKFGFAGFLRKKVSFLPSLIGWNEIERRQYHELIERGIRRRFEIYGRAPIANRKMSRKRVNENKYQTALKRHEVAVLIPTKDSIMTAGSARRTSLNVDFKTTEEVTGTMPLEKSVTEDKMKALHG